MPGIIDPDCLVVIGLHAGHAARKSLGSLNRQLNKISVMTFDDLADAAEHHLANLRSLGHSTSN